VTTQPQPLAGSNALDGASWLDRSARNLATMWEYAPRAMGWRWRRWNDAWAADPISLSPIPNSATVIQPLEASRTGELIDRLRNFYGEVAGAPFVLWSAWRLPDLRARGFELLGHPPLMVRLAGEALPDAPPALRVVEVTDAPTLADFEHVSIDGYPIEELRPARAGSMYDTRILGGPFRLWVGYVDGQPVSGAYAYNDNVVNGIYLVSTLPAYRGRGYAAALTARAVASAPDLPAVLQATVLGYRIYTRLGFHEVAQYDLWLKPR
jgi:GNAT superfamily N-acetyltransferase